MCSKTTIRIFYRSASWEGKQVRVLRHSSPTARLLLIACLLLLYIPVSDEVEKSMIAKLKAECGYQFTTKLEGMFVDMNISKTLMEQFKQSPFFNASNNASAGKGPLVLSRPPPNLGAANMCDLEVMMLSTSNWPLTAVPECNLPSILMTCCRQFGDFYFDKHSGRKLIWMTHLGNCDLKVTLGFTVSYIHTCISYTYIHAYMPTYTSKPFNISNPYRISTLMDPHL
jgi:hypothetical protein